MMEPYDLRIQRVLCGQQGPLIDGGIHILFHCATCQRVWLMQGKKVQVHLSDQERRTWASRLHADLSHLPQATCRICSTRLLGGEFALDEYVDVYGQPRAYGYCWEGLHPAEHFLVSVSQQRWMNSLSTPADLHYHIVTQPQGARAVLVWLALSTRSSFVYQPFPKEAIHQLTQDNVPGAHAPETTNWTWYGGFWTASCPALQGEVFVSFAQAGPAGQKFSLTAALAAWRRITERALAYGIAGEQAMREEE